MVTDLPVLIVCVARTELLHVRPAWGGGKARATAITLEPLSDEQSAELIGELLGQTDAGREVSQRIARAAEGNPLFVEELLRMLIDRGALVRRDGRWTGADHLDTVAVPPTIQALLAARIDGLRIEERAVLESASVEGQLFHVDAIAELVPESLSDGVRGSLESLAHNDLVRAVVSNQNCRTEQTYRFKHLLIRDAAYASIPKQKRAEMHARFARWLASLTSDTSAELDEILGYHYQQAFLYRTELGAMDDEARNLGALAAQHLGAAGRRALDRSDLAAARKLLEAAIKLLPENDLESYRLGADLALTMAAAGEISSAQTLAGELFTTAKATGDGHAIAYTQLAHASVMRATGGLTFQEALKIHAKVLAQLERDGDERGMERATLELARSSFWAGGVARATELLTASMRRNPHPATHELLAWLPPCVAAGPTPVNDALPLIDQILADSPNQTTESMARCARAYLFAMIGRFDDAREDVRRAVAIRRELGHEVIAAALLGVFGGHVELVANDYVAAERETREAYEALSRMGARQMAATVVALLASAEFGAGKLAEADLHVSEARELGTPGDVQARGYALYPAVRLLVVRGLIDEALSTSSEAITLADAADYFELRILARMCRAEALRAAGQFADAVTNLQEARESAHAKGATVYMAQIDARLAEAAAEHVLA